MFKRIVLTALLVASSGVSQAALVDWYPTFDTESVEDVVTIGSTVEALNFASDGSLYDIPREQDVLIGDIDFLESTTIFSSDAGERRFLAADYTGATTGDVAYDMLLDTLDFGNGVDPLSFQAGNGSLVSGRTYLVQLWFTDLRGGASSDRSMKVSDGLGNDAFIHATGEGLGQYVIGTFVADGASQDLQFQVGGDFANAHMNAYQLRDVTGALTIDLEEGRNLAAVPAQGWGVALLMLFAGGLRKGKRREKV